MNERPENDGVMHIGRIEIDATLFNNPVNTDSLPILPTRNLVLFPGISLPISLTRETSLKLAKEASRQHIPVGIVCQLDADNENPTSISELHPYGVVADIFQVVELPDGSHTAIVRARQRIKLLSDSKVASIDCPVNASVKVLKENQVVRKNAADFENLMGGISELAIELAQHGNADKAFTAALRQITDLHERLNFIATNAPADPAEKVRVLSEGPLHSRAMALMELLLAQKDKMQIFDDLVARAREKMNENQRNAFLQSQLEAIKEELYGTVDDGDDYEKLMDRYNEAVMPDDIKQKALNEINKLRRYNTNSPDYSVQYNYIDTLLNMPWSSSPASSDIVFARETLEKDHYGLAVVKQRILEQIAVMINNPSVKAPILCLVGPPGVGKTSLGQSVARSLGRVYERVALGGVHDETEIRGHRRTYVGAMPGRIVKALESAKCNNPVLLLDEIDKLGKSMHGDPGSALLEVLDPEQNSTFHDNFLEVPYDLSKVFFIATANTLASIPTPLLDRMEIIELPAYTVEEKKQIARRHLLPKAFKNNGLNADGEGFAISDEALEHVIQSFTGREAGVRQLEKVMGSLIRKMILSKLCKESFPSPLEAADIDRLLSDSSSRRTFGRVGFSASAR